MPVLWLLHALLACAGAPAPGDFGPAPSFSLTDQNGRTRTSADLAGRVWVADFIFTSCTTICPTLTAGMADLQSRHPDLIYVSFSVDPQTDTPSVLLAFAERFHAAPGWHFLTGPTDQVRKAVVDGFKQAMETSPGGGPGGTDSVIHGNRFVVIDKEGRMRGFPAATGSEVEEILDAL